MSNYYTILTRVGAALHANAQVNQTTVPWTHMRLGDGNGAPVTPTENQTSLVHQVHVLPITDIAVHPDNPNWVIAEAVVPSDVGGWTVRETAIYGGADGNTCIAVGNYPETYKPVLAEGAGREMVMRMVVEISSVATVKLQIDPAVAIASRAWVESLVATPAKAGLVKLASLQEHLDGESSSKAATPAGVHAVVGIATEQVMGEVLALQSKIGIAGQAKDLRCWATGTDALVRVTADQIFLDSAGGQTLKLRGVDLTINTATVGANGLDTGVLAANTWYSKWVISDGVSARGLISLSATAPTMPVGYTHKARVGWVRTDSTANKYPLAFVQRDKRVQYVVASGSNLASLPRMVSGPQGNAAAVVPTFVPVSVDAFVPSTAVSINLILFGYAAGNSAIAAPNSSHYGVGGVGLSGASPLHISMSYSVSATHLAVTGEMLLESRNIYFAAQSNPSGLLCLGWEDSL